MFFISHLVVIAVVASQLSLDVYGFAEAIFGSNGNGLGEDGEDFDFGIIENEDGTLTGGGPGTLPIYLSMSFHLMHSSISASVGSPAYTPIEISSAESDVPVPVQPNARLRVVLCPDTAAIHRALQISDLSGNTSYTLHPLDAPWP